jgi:uncharacterized protein YndB with AHSA1/START domain
MIDVHHEINAVARQVGTRVLDSGQARVVTLGRTYPVPIEDLWDACTSADRIARWFLPVHGTLAVGERFQLEGNAGGTVTRCDPPRGFDATWEFGDQVSWIELRLTAVSAQATRFELDHIAHVDDDLWAQFGPGAVGIGWDTGLLGLGQHFAAEAAGTEALDASRGPAWLASDEGHAFIAASSEAWHAASLAAGTPAADARAAADRVASAYTGG